MAIGAPAGQLGGEGAIEGSDRDLQHRAGLGHAQGQVAGEQQPPEQGKQGIENPAQALGREPGPHQQEAQGRQGQGQGGEGQPRQQRSLAEAGRSEGQRPQQPLPVVQGQVTGQHQEQAGFRRRRLQVPLQVGGRWPQAQLHRAVRAGLGTTHAQNTVAVGAEVGRVGPERAAGRGQALTVGGTALETAVGAAAATAGAHLGAQFQDRELGKQAVHAPHRTQIPAPKAFLKAQRADHGPGGDQQQQATAQLGAVLQVPDRFPEQDCGKASGQQGRGPIVARSPRPLRRFPTQ